MGIINGTFDTDTSGWTLGNNAVASVEDGKARIHSNSYNPDWGSWAYMSQTFVIDHPFLKFDINIIQNPPGVLVDCLPWSLIVDGVEVISRCEQAHPCFHVDISPYIGKSGTLIFRASAANRYGIWADVLVDNVMLVDYGSNWQCEPGQTGYEIDGCGNRRENPACAYREAELISCEWPAGTLIAGETYQVVATVNQGSTTENYKLVFSGDYTGESSPFTVNAGTGQQQFTVDIIFATGGQKTVTAVLVKV